MAKEKWVVSPYWDVTTGAGSPRIECFHVCTDGKEHSCDISPMSEACQDSLLHGKYKPGIVVKCLACGALMSAEDEIIFRL